MSVKFSEQQLKIKYGIEKAIECHSDKGGISGVVKSCYTFIDSSLRYRCIQKDSSKLNMVLKRQLNVIPTKEESMANEILLLIHRFFTPISLHSEGQLKIKYGIEKAIECHSDKGGISDY
ncbi:MAG TPA: hypothetical protein VFM70_12135 [Salinimicrobium sp.]|nr:hypothetical protein [Salinimicrobium sp.]